MKTIKEECPYESYCNVRKFGRINCMKPKDCQTFKFYEKYGKNYDEMFIGSKKSPVKKQLDEFFREDMEDF